MSDADYQNLVERNLLDVFSQRDATARLRAIEALYTADPTLYEPASIVRGCQAISDTIGQLLATLPPDFVFHAAGPAIGHHGVCCAQWRGGPPDGPAILSGSDVIQLEHGRIAALYVFINPSPR